MSEQAKRSVKDLELLKTPFGTLEVRPHANDLTMDLRCHTAEDLFQLATWGLARIQVSDWPETINFEERVELVSDDWDDQIVNWLNQLIFLTEKHRAVWTEVEFETLTDQKVTAVVKGREWPEEEEDYAREVKSASYVGIEVIPGPPLWQARINLDM